MALTASAQAQPAKHGKPCSIAECYDAAAKRGPAELAALNAILYEQGHTQGQVFEILTRDGDFEFKIGFQSVNKHRGKSCRCFREEPFRFCHDCKRDNESCVCGDAA